MCTNKTPLISIIALLSLLLCSACAEDRPKHKESKSKINAPFYEAISVEKQELVRSVLNKFSADGADGVDVTEILNLVVDEGLRNYPDSAWIDDVHLSNISLDMTQALPENDLWGDYNPNGGALRFQETTHDEEGNVLTDVWVSKIARHFSEGSIDGFTYRSIDQSSSSLSTVSENHVSFTVAEQATYNVDAWHLQKSYASSSGTGVSHNETYNYQSAPVMKLTLNAGSDHTESHTIVDKIHHAAGWTVDTNSIQNSNLTGTLTLYQPSSENAEANIREASEPINTGSVKNNIKTSNEEWTTVTTVDSYVGQDDSLVRRETTTHTFEQNTDRDASSGAPFSEDSYEHITTVVTHHPREGASATLLQNRVRENYPDYTVTTKVLRQSSTTYRSFQEEQVSCAIGGSGNCPPGTECQEGPNGEGRCMGMGCPNDEKMWGTSGTGAAVCSFPLRHEESVTTYRYTDHPHNRHDIEAWKSTSSTWSRNWNEEKQFVDDIGGEEWLTAQIVVDPQFDAVPFVWDGKIIFQSADLTQLLDPAGEASESTSTHQTTMDFEAGWGGNTISFDGGYSQSTATIQGAGSNVHHSNGGNVVGSIVLKINDAKHTISGEQWLDQLAP